MRRLSSIVQQPSSIGLAFVASVFLVSWPFSTDGLLALQETVAYECAGPHRSASKSADRPTLT